jgi:hypothetical protein
LIIFSFGTQSRIRGGIQDAQKELPQLRRATRPRQSELAAVDTNLNWSRSMGFFSEKRRLQEVGLQTPSPKMLQQRLLGLLPIGAMTRSSHLLFVRYTTRADSGN